MVGEAELWRDANSDQPIDAAPVLARTASRLSKLDKTRVGPIQELIELLEDKDWLTPPSVLPRAVRALEHLCDATDRGAAAEAFELTDVLYSELRLELEGHQQFSKQREQIQTRRRLDGPSLEAATSEARRSARAEIQQRQYLAGQNWWAHLKERMGI